MPRRCQACADGPAVRLLLGLAGARRSLLIWLRTQNNQDSGQLDLGEPCETLQVLYARLDTGLRALFGISSSVDEFTCVPRFQRLPDDFAF